MGGHVSTTEFLEAGCTAQPGFTEVAPGHEEEGARARADATLQWSMNGGLHLAPRTPYPEEWQALSKDTVSCHGDNRLLQLHVMGNPVDGSMDHCEKTHCPVACRDDKWQAPHEAGKLTKIAGTRGQEELGITAGPAGTWHTGERVGEGQVLSWTTWGLPPSQRRE